MATNINYTYGVPGGSGMFKGVGVSSGPRALTSEQTRRRLLRQKLAEAAGLVKPGEAFQAYGPHKTAGADQLLKGGSGLGQGLGAARRQTKPSLLDQYHQQQAIAARRRARKSSGPAGGKPVV